MRVLIGVALDSPQMERLRASFPKVEFVTARGGDEMRERVPGCEVLFGGHPGPDIVAAADALKWVQSFSAGVNHFPLDALRERGIALTTGSGAHGVPIAENILAMMLAFATGLAALAAARPSRAWVQHDVGTRKFELEGQTLLVVGMGAIGSTLAAKADGLGMTVWGYRRRALPAPRGVQRMVGADGLDSALAEADHVALCLPLTAETTAFLDERRLRLLKPTAYVYNVGRGQSIAREPLIRALREGWFAGAGLDVTDPEPLPADDPLWDLPNALLMQHTSGWSPKTEGRVVDLFIDNLGRYTRGEPLRNLVDPEARY